MLKYKYDSLTRLQERIKSLREEADERAKEFREEKTKYREAWMKEFMTKLDDSGRTWCTKCGMLILKERAHIGYALEMKQDHYSPAFPYSTTKHRTCSICAERLRNKKEADDFGAPVKRDDTTNPPGPKTIEQAKELFFMPPLMS